MIQKKLNQTKLVGIAANCTVAPCLVPETPVRTKQHLRQPRKLFR